MLRHYSYPRALAFVLPLLAAAGCKDQPGAEIDREKLARDVATVVCDAFASCACDSVAIGNASECATAIQPALEQAIVRGEEIGLRYYSECLDRAETLLASFGCGDGSNLDEAGQQAAFEAGICKLLAGDAGLGDPCTTVGTLGFGGVGDTCKHDLVCATGICVRWPDRQGSICEGIGVCPPGLSCTDPDADGVHSCEPRSESGGPCNPHDGAAGCGPDLFCSEVSQTCTSLPGTGQACLANQCASGHVCQNDVCVVPPGNGQACPDGVCGEGLVCSVDGGDPICVALPGEGQMCFGGFGCAAGLVCDLGVCVEPPAAVCSVPGSIGLCIYQGDGLCDEPEGTGLCQEGTDPQDCTCPTELDGICDEPEGTGNCLEGTDPGDCENFCATQANGVCDEPEGTGTCPENSDALDCGGGTCPTVNDGVCDEPEGTGTCLEGSDAVDCGAPPCPYVNDGICDEPEGTGACAEGTDTADCAALCPTAGDGVCDEPEGTGNCPEGSDPIDCPPVVNCPTQNNGVCDEYFGTCSAGTDPFDCQCFTAGDGICNEPAPAGDGSCDPGTDTLDC